MTPTAEEQDIINEEACLEFLENTFDSSELAKFLWEKMTVLEKESILQDVKDEWEDEQRANAMA